MEIPDRLLSLRRAVEYGKENGKTNLIVNLELLDLLLRGELPVGGNELPPEEVTKRLYALKAERDELRRKLGDTTRELGVANVRGDQAEAQVLARDQWARDVSMFYEMPYEGEDLFATIAIYLKRLKRGDNAKPETVQADR